MIARLARFRTELLLALSLLLPLLLPTGGGLDSVLLGVLAPLPALPGRSVAVDPDAEALRNLRLENAELRSRLLALGEPGKLKAMDSAYFARNPVRIEAPVLGRDASPYRGSLVIGAGSREGVAEGQPVVVGKALVGVVAKVGPITSWVRLLTDPGMRVWGEVISMGSRGEGYLAGSGDRLLDMGLVAADAGKIGDPVFTGVGSESIPRGLFVGRVARFTDMDRSGTAEVEVRPALAPRDLRVVNVLAPGD